MKKIFWLFIVLIILAGTFIIYKKVNHNQIPLETLFLTGQKRDLMMEQNLKGKKLLMIIAFKDFKDEEYFIPREILEKAGAEIKVASTKKGTALGTSGGEVNVDLDIDEVMTDDYDGIIFIGGPGAFNHLDNFQCHRIAKEAKEKDKVLAAICIGPAILAKAGVLQGKKATVWSSALDKSAIKILEEGGAQYQDQEVVVDRKIVTASGPQAAEEFGNKLVEILSQ